LLDEPGSSLEDPKNQIITVDWTFSRYSSTIIGPHPSHCQWQPLHMMMLSPPQMTDRPQSTLYNNSTGIYFLLLNSIF
jgi:hypothetical protein